MLKRNKNVNRADELFALKLLYLDMIGERVSKREIDLYIKNIKKLLLLLEKMKKFSEKNFELQIFPFINEPSITRTIKIKFGLNNTLSNTFLTRTPLKWLVYEYLENIDKKVLNNYTHRDLASVLHDKIVKLMSVYFDISKIKYKEKGNFEKKIYFIVQKYNPSNSRLKNIKSKNPYLPGFDQGSFKGQIRKSYHNHQKNNLSKKNDKF